MCDLKPSKTRTRRCNQIVDRECGFSDSGGEQYSPEEFVELVVRADPRPLNHITGPFADSANVPARSHRPVVRVAAQFLEL